MDDIEERESTSIDTLPDEVLEIVLRNLAHYDDLWTCAQVCSRWLHVSRRVYTLKQRLFKQALLSGPVAFSSSSSYNSLESPSTSFSTARYSHSAAVAGDFMYVFGGCSSSFNSMTTFNDLWKIDLNSKRKSRILTSGNYPTPKAHSSMVVCRNSLILFGGWTSPSSLQQLGSLFDELHVYSIDQNTWTQMYLPFSPPPSAGHSASVHGDLVVIFGGMQKNNLSSSPSNDIYCLDLENSEWFKAKTNGVKPEPRAGQSQIKINERNILIISGCSGVNHRQNDVWLLTIPECKVRSEYWTWREITINNTEFMPKQMWSYPTCKLDNDHVVILARQNSSDANGVLVEQENKPNEMVWHPPEPIVKLPNGHQNSSHSNSFDNFGRPSVRMNACNNREKRLLMLSKYEEHIREVQKQQQKIVEMRRRQSKPSCCMQVYLLNTSKVLTDFEVEWTNGPSWENICPHPRVKCTLLLGKGELVLCCGKETEECSCNPIETISQLLYIKAPNTFS